MIAYIKGILTQICENSIILETYGIGYEIMMPLSTIANHLHTGEEMKIYTYQYVKEDALDLYGFLSKDDLEVFKLLITVNGIGPKGALNILSSISPDDLRLAVLSDDVKKIKEAPGIGAKTAQKLIIELKDKMSIEDVLEKETNDDGGVVSVAAGADTEVIEALVALGYSSSEAIRAVKSIDKTKDMKSEEMLRLALKKLAFM